MKTRSLNIVITSVFVLALLTNCNSESKPDNFDYGRVSNNIYTNDYFNCTMQLPADWKIQTKEQTQRMVEMGRELVAGDNENMKNALKASDINSANMLVASQYEIGAAVEYNPSLIIVAENIQHAPGIKKGSDYLYQTRRLINQGQVQYDSISSEFENELINGTGFYKMGTFINYLGLDIKQTYYSTITKGFSFVIIISFVTDEQKDILLESVKSLKME